MNCGIFQSLLFVLISLQGTSVANESLHLENIGIGTEEVGTDYFSHDTLDIAIIREALMKIKQVPLSEHCVMKPT
jgi:hypothetical protein